MTKRQIILLMLLGIAVLIILIASNAGSLLKTQVSPPTQGSIIICSHIMCAETTDDGVQTNCRRTIVQCSSPSCNAGPCLASSVSPPPSPSPVLIPVSPSLQPVVPSTTPAASTTVSSETPHDELMIWQELGVIISSVFRYLGRTTLDFINSI